MSARTLAVTDLGSCANAWLAHFTLNPQEASECVAELGQLHPAIPTELRGKWLGATLALTPPEFRCSHLGDTRTCFQCGLEQQEAESLERENGRLAETVERQRGEIDRLGEALRGGDDD